MKFEKLVIGNIEAKLPIIQGGIGVGVSLCNLAGEVAKNGAIGVISAAHPGYMESDFHTNTLEANIRGLKKNIKKAKELSNGGIIGVNIMVALKHYEDFVKASIEAGADLIISGAGLPLNLPKYASGSTIKLIPIVSSVKAVNVILKYWKSHYNACADAVVIEGPLAGGHLGFKADKIENEILSFDENVKNIIAEIKKFEDIFKKDIPVIVGGGVYDKKDIIKYLELGAQGVQIGTRFVATEECDAHINFKNAYINAKKDDIKIIKSPVGMPGRALNNKFINNINTGIYKPKKCYNCIISCNPATTPYCITQALINSVKGDVDNGLVFCGENAYKVDKIITVKELLDELTN